MAVEFIINRSCVGHMVNIFKLNTEELEALVIYKEVITKDDRFPKDFWSAEKDQTSGIKTRCRILTRYCLENMAGLKVEDLPKYNLKQIKEMLVRGRLSGMVQRVFEHDVLAILKNAYPVEFKNRVLKEWYWSKHGVWQNEEFIIEAVKEMVRKEGIRWIGDIPSLDWKKRLLKHGIYNVLSYFDWSIYSLFNFVYPNRFHPTDFKYKIKWSASESLENAFYFMHNIFKKKGYSVNQVLLLKTVDFRKLGLSGMLMTLFDSSTIKAKEYYLYRTIDNREHQEEIRADIRRLRKEITDKEIRERLQKIAKGKYIYNLHSHHSLYSYVKRHARTNNMSISDFIAYYGFVYKSAKKDIRTIDKDEIWSLRKKGLTYVQIAEKLGSNPTTIVEMCNRYFGGDPLIPRPISDYITVQELMNIFRVDHKTVMKIVHRNGFENHTTIRFRYLKKSEIIPALQKYVQTSRHHKFMVQRYPKSGSDYNLANNEGDLTLTDVI
jgi:hypothetical protein